MKLQGDAALSYWKETARDLLAASRRQGICEEESRDEVRRFFGAVQAELQAFQLDQTRRGTAGGTAA